MRGRSNYPSITNNAFRKKSIRGGTLIHTASQYSLLIFSLYDGQNILASLKFH